MHLYKKRISPVLQQEYKEYCQTNDDNDNDDEDEWSFHCRRATEMLEEESEEVKEKVEKYRLRTGEDSSSDEDTFDRVKNRKKHVSREGKILR